MSIAFAEIFLHRPAGCANCVSGFAPNGRLLFLHRLTGVHELPQAGSPLTGGVFFAEIQRWGFAVCGRRGRCGARRGDDAVPTAVGKKKGHLRFPFLFELLPFPCFLIWRRFPICDRSEIRGTAEDFFFRVFRNLFAVSDTNPQARHVCVAQLVARCYGRHLRIIIDVRLYLVAPYGINRANDIRNNTDKQKRRTENPNVICTPLYWTPSRGYYYAVHI